MLSRQVTKRQSKIVEIQDIDDSNVNDKLNKEEIMRNLN